MDEKVGKYLIKGKIAEGGMGAIYIARHPTLNRDIILKRLILRRSHSITERFKREAELMIDFRDERIVQVYDFFKEGNSYYIAMEYVKGISLADLIKKKRYIPNEIAVLIFSEICRALKYAHEKGVIHRDIKPPNILISNEGEIKLTDFGIARSAEDMKQKEGLTMDGMTLGTPAYMSPEQISDSRNVDKRADIYSMGVVLYEMVTGKCPFSGSFTSEAISQIQKGDYLPPKNVNPKISPVLQKVIKKAMHRKAKSRYKDLRYILAILRRYLRRYKDKAAVNQTIKEYLQGKIEDASAKQGFALKEKLKRILDILIFRISSNFSRIVLTFAILTAALAGGGYYLYLKGIHNEYLMSDRMGALRVSIRIDKKFKGLDEKYININLFRLSDGKSIPVTDPELKIPRQAVADNKGYYTLKSNKIYLPASNYRISAEIENELYQRDFNLEPRVLQKTGKENFECMSLEIRHRGAMTVPLRLFYSARDANSGQDITDETDLYIYNGRWQKWQDFAGSGRLEDTFITGRIYKFKFASQRYFTNFLRIEVKPFQSVLTVETEMVPLPGVILYRSNEEGIIFLVNNSENYISGGRSREYKMIERAGLKFKSLSLSPGQYYITAKKSNNITKTVEAVIEPGRTAKVYINYDSGSDRIGLEIK